MEEIDTGNIIDKKLRGQAIDFVGKENELAGELDDDEEDDDDYEPPTEDDQMHD